ncbi:unnamed protein product [Polarella glacialis]|uniref:Nudix hydrolase domain-containing protein n=1 Tax=Polarella glacialis TaxID=89957 RepID=A0A813F0M6_POLGL|nr:unnamed protein product [Polarella glacialis]
MATTGPRVLLVVGPFRSGKTSLIRRLVDKQCPETTTPTIGLEAGAMYHLAPEQPGLSCRLKQLLPASGMELEIMEIGGKEACHREVPRGRRVVGLLVCYDTGDRDSFLRASHVVGRHRMDRYRAISAAGIGGAGHFAGVLCGTKGDLNSSQAASAADAKAFAEANGLRTALVVSARTGQGVEEAFQALVEAVLEQEAALGAEQDLQASLAGRSASQAWSLMYDASRGGDGVGKDWQLTQPRGVRPHEPPRGLKQPMPAAIEVLDRSGGLPCEPRTLEQCLKSGLLHRAVHVWICVPRSGALLLRKWSKTAPKHPGRWGPTAHSELRCYGAGGDGHAAEVSAQAAERSLSEQLGISSSSLGELRHMFSVESLDGSCKELLDIYVASLGSEGLPEMKLQEGEEVDWVYFGHVLSKQAAAASSQMFSCQAEYRTSLARCLRAGAVKEDVRNAFGIDLDAPGSPKLPAR